MNRPIKFRIWDKEKKQFFTLKNAMVLAIGNTDKFLAFSTNQGLYPIPDTGQENLGWDRWTLQQFTGLIDKNEKEIYEGNLVKIDPDHIANRLRAEENPAYTKGEIMWLQEGFKVVQAYLGATWLGNFSACDCCPCGLEIIGNIFENKELAE